MPTVIPILRSRDLASTAAFYETLEFVERARYEGYLLLEHPLGAEVHFWFGPQVDPKRNEAGCYVRFASAAEARALHDAWSAAQPADVGPLEETDYGLTEFALRDLDGNQIRVGGVTG